MKFSIGCDHGGYEYKMEIIRYLESIGHQVIDCGTFSKDSCHYPEFAIKAAEMVKDGKVDRGIVVCRSGEGVSIAANKVKGVRCALAYNETVARLCREHNDANMIAFGADYFSLEEVKRMLDQFIKAEFAKGNHETRVNIIKNYENK
ncbi:MAG: ribose 5-phosphate isomerase B [Erysipelotrichales bacterium]|nr:ribose 5-phosphate isomerase B [Erysipelotrichales bacterium]